MGERVSVVASFMLDFVIRAPRRPAPGETVRGTGFDMFLGGKGFNQSVAARRAGAPVAAIGRLGDDDFGRRFRASLTAEGIDDRHVVTDPDEGTGIAAPVVEPSGENSIIIVPRANLAVTPADIEAAADTIATSGVLLLQLEVPTEAVVAAATSARQAGVPVILNPAPAADVLDQLAGSIDVLVPNEAEAAALAGGSVDDDPAALARALRDRTGAAVVLTLGAAGALVLDGDGVMTLGAHDVPVVDTVGAGDAFCGTLGGHLAAGRSLAEAAVQANAAGALAVTRTGAEPSMPTAAAVAELLATSPVA